MSCFKVLEKMVFITIPGRHLDGETWCEYEQELQRDVHRDSGESPEQDAGGDHHHGQSPHQSTQIITVHAYLLLFIMPFPFWTICLIFNPFEVGMRFYSRKENIPFMMSSEYLA